MRTEEEIKKKLEKEYGLYSYTNDATVLQNECYQRIITMEWILGKREEI